MQIKREKPILGIRPPLRVALTQHFPFPFNCLPASVYMKPTVTEDEFEDAEEENKFINEVRVSSRV